MGVVIVLVVIYASGHGAREGRPDFTFALSRNPIDAISLSKSFTSANLLATSAIWSSPLE
jgi:hypothetical protein